MNIAGRLLASGATVVLLFTSHHGPYAVAQDPAENRLAGRIDPYVEKQRNEARPKLRQPGFPAADSLKAVIVPGQPGYGMGARRSP